MDEEAEGRGRDLVRALCPALEGMVGGTAEWVERPSAESLGKGIDHTLRPAVEGVWFPVGRFRRSVEGVEAEAAGPTDEHERARRPVVD
jgi:hypothetical protein